MTVYEVQRQRCSSENLCATHDGHLGSVLGPGVVPSIPGAAQDVVEAGRKDALAHAINDRLARIAACVSEHSLTVRADIAVLGKSPRTGWRLCKSSPEPA